MSDRPVFRAVTMLLAVLATGCVGQRDADLPPSPEEQRLLAYLARDPYVVIERTERDHDGHLLVMTSQGRRQVRYLIAPDDPARPEPRLRRLDDESRLETAPNPHPGGMRYR